MTVKELIEELKQCNPDYKVVMSKDPEGNGFRYLYEVDSHSKFDGDEDVRLAELTPELREQGYTEEDLGDPDDEDVVVLWP